MPKLSIPAEPELRWTLGIVVGAVAVLVLAARVFRDVQPG